MPASRLTLALRLTVAIIAAQPSISTAQLRKLRVVSVDSQPVVYAYVTVGGGTGQITDERGEVSFGQGKRQTLDVVVRRIGYGPWTGKLEFPDTAATITVVMPRLTQQLEAVSVTAAPGSAVSVPLHAFYERWMMRQKGLLSAVFIGPEELEFRHPSNLTDMLRGLNGVYLKNLPGGGVAAFNSNGCPMAIVVDGNRRCPLNGCKGLTGVPNGSTVQEVHTQSGSYIVLKTNLAGGEAFNVDLNQTANASDIAAIEVYARGGNMPVSLQVSDQACGVIAIWTGSRKP